MQLTIVNCADWTGKEEAHASLQRQLNFPEWYGANLDALYDLLTEQEWHILLINTRAARKNLGGEMGRLMQVFEDSGALAGTWEESAL